MRVIWLVLVILALIFTMLSCADTKMKLQEAQAGLDEAIAQLSGLDDFDTVTVISGTSSSTSDGKTCYYAQAGLAIGTSLSAQSALETYVSELQVQGWVIKQNDFERSMVLTRGEHERISVSLNGPSWMIEADEGYQRAKDIYPTFIFATITFILPSREGC